MTDTKKYVARIQLKILYFITEDVVKIARNTIGNFHVFTTSFFFFKLVLSFLKLWYCSVVLFFNSGNLEIKLLCIH